MIESLPLEKLQKYYAEVPNSCREVVLGYVTYYESIKLVRLHIIEFAHGEDMPYLSYIKLCHCKVYVLSSRLVLKGLDIGGFWSRNREIWESYQLYDCGISWLIFSFRYNSNITLVPRVGLQNAAEHGLVHGLRTSRTSCTCPPNSL